MRSGGKAQTKKIIQQKQRVRQQQTHELAPFDAVKFHEFMRVRWYLTTNQVLTVYQRNLSELWLVTLLDIMINQRPMAATKVQSLNTHELISESLKHLQGFKYQHFLKLLDLAPRLFKFLKRELAVNPYFVLDEMPDKAEFTGMVASVLAQNLSYSQGFSNQLTTQYTALFLPADQLDLATISELYRGQTTIPVNAEQAKADSATLSTLKTALVAKLAHTDANAFALRAICSDAAFLTALSHQSVDELLLSPFTIIPNSWQPTNETLLGIGHQIATIVSTSEISNVFSAETWQQFDGVLAVAALNSLVK